MFLKLRLQFCLYGANSFKHTLSILTTSISTEKAPRIQKFIYCVMKLHNTV